MGIEHYFFLNLIKLSPINLVQPLTYNCKNIGLLNNGSSSPAHYDDYSGQASGQWSLADHSDRVGCACMLVGTCPNGSFLKKRIVIFLSILLYKCLLNITIITSHLRINIENINIAIIKT